MKWKPCTKPTCKHFTEAEPELETRRGFPRVSIDMYFELTEHPGYNTFAGTKWMAYPCLHCKHYEPTKLDYYEEK